MNNEFNNIQFDPMTGQTITQQIQLQSKKKVNAKLLIIIAIVIVIIIIGIVFIPKLFGNKEKENLVESLTSSTSFWIQNNDGLYAMFDVDGKQLTEFEYIALNHGFVNGTAIVKNNNDEYGLISSTGKMIVDFGKYDYIYGGYSNYEMVDTEYNKYLYDNSGKFIRKLDSNEDVISYIGEYTYALIESDKEYTVIDYNGKEITTIAIPNEDDDIYSPDASSDENYVSIFYNNVNYIIDISKRKVLVTIPDSRQFCIGDINEENPEEFILATCNASYGEEQNDGFKLIRNGKIAYSKESSIDYATMNFEGNNVVYRTDEIYLLDENGNETIDSSGYIIYKDYKNYIIEAEGILNGAELYVNGALKEKLECDNIQGEYAKHGVYLLDYCSGYGNGNKIYINADGTRINDKSYKYAYEFDTNGYASVSEDGKNYYLINLKGEKVSDYYSSDGSSEKIYNIHGTDNLYHGPNEDGTQTIFEVNGDKILTGRINFNNLTTIADEKYVSVEKNNKYTVYNLTKRKEIITLDTEPDMSSDYFTTSNDSKTQYYSYTTGKLFYEE